jgi:repressor LexA
MFTYDQSMKNDHFKKIQAFYEDFRRMPSYREIMRITALRSTNAVYKLINRLQKKGYIEKDSSGHIIPKHMLGDIPFIKDYVEAGTGWISPADEELRDTINLDQLLIGPNREAAVLVRVKGDSMIEADLSDGDTAIAIRGAPYKDGSIVVAIIDGKQVVKILRTEGKKSWLEPANKKYKSLYPKEELRVIAVVRSSFRVH